MGKKRRAALLSARATPWSDHRDSSRRRIERYLNGRRFDSRWAASKKQAEQLAALAALVELEVAFESEDGSVEIKENYGE